MSDLFEDYGPAVERAGAYDEMFAPGMLARGSYGHISESLGQLTLADVSARAESMARTFLDRGVTFDYAG
ncbi:circularly permuted type 2 ATP-grasp protein, partial [Arthrobacter sp. B2a2-09]|nr:circularly permuted type 2 ATP-grasp protein [Arthrobacter sp. B2a2-09]